MNPLIYIQNYAHVLEWLGLLSALTFFGSLIAVPMVIARMPADYFISYRQKIAQCRRRHPIITWIVFVFRNSIGFFFVLAGIAMLVLPGQGILTILIGIAMMDVPGKHRLVEHLIGRRSVMRGLNWIRKKAHQPPFEFKIMNG